MGHADETFRSVVLGVFNDFLDGDLEVIRTLLSMYLILYVFSVNVLINSKTEAINDINPSIKLGEEGINSVLVTLQSIRERALSKFKSHPFSFPQRLMFRL